MRRTSLGMLLVVAVATFTAAPAAANNDPVAPANECASDQGNAIGHPNDPFGANNGADVLEARTGGEMQNPVDAPASRNNPGNAVTDNDTSANGQESSQATGHCANAGP